MGSCIDIVWSRSFLLLPGIRRYQANVWQTLRLTPNLKRRYWKKKCLAKDIRLLSNKIQYLHLSNVLKSEKYAALAVRRRRVFDFHEWNADMNEMKFLRKLYSFSMKGYRDSDSSRRKFPCEFKISMHDREGRVFLASLNCVFVWTIDIHFNITISNQILPSLAELRV